VHKLAHPARQVASAFLHCCLQPPLPHLFWHCTLVCKQSAAHVPASARQLGSGVQAWYVSGAPVSTKPPSPPLFVSPELVPSFPPAVASLTDAN
jgi:hypothetical protein